MRTPNYRMIAASVPKRRASVWGKLRGNKAVSVTAETANDVNVIWAL